MTAAAGASAAASIYDDESALVEDYFDQGWTDGLPIVAPTPRRVRRHLDAAGLVGVEIIGAVPTRDVIVTAEQVAINSVMAGCRPEYFPVVVASLRAHLSSLGNSHSTTGSMMGPAHALIINGPMRRELDIACGPACMGPGFRANATIGRAFRLVIRNACRGTPELFDRASFSWPLCYSFCFGEDEESSAPWLPLHVQRGFEPSDSTVTIASLIDMLHISSGLSRNPREVLDDVARTVRFHGTIADTDEFIGDQAAITFVVGPEHMRYFHEFNWSKADAQTYLLDRLQKPTRGPNDAAIQFTRPDQLVFVAAGGGGMSEVVALMPHLSATLTELVIPAEPTKGTQVDTQQALGVLHDILRVDGAQLTVARAAADSLTLLLTLDGADCADCVMPASILERICLQGLHEAGSTVSELRIIDPRVDVAGAGH